jgi:hypothetical protein
MLKQSVNWEYQWGQIVGRAWADDEFSQRLLADPISVLTEYDVPPPAGLRVEVLTDPGQIPEASAGVMHLLMPAKPSDAELSEDDFCSTGGPVGVDRCGCGGCGCGGCGGCRGCAACVWCY